MNIRIIPKLDIKGPNLIKGLFLDGYRILGTPEIFAEIYYREGADELFFQDVVTSLYRRNNLLGMINRTAQCIFVPLTVAGGIRSTKDIKNILRVGADKVDINTAAIENLGLLKEATKVFGSQCIVSSIEAKKKEKENMKFGLGRVSRDAQQDIRRNHITREEGVALMRRYDHEFPKKHFRWFLDSLSVSEDFFWEVMDFWRKNSNVWEKSMENGS
jgi:cyclase